MKHFLVFLVLGPKEPAAYGDKEAEPRGYDQAPKHDEGINYDLHINKYSTGNT